MKNPHFGIDFHEVIAQLDSPVVAYMAERDETCGHRENWIDDLVDGQMPDWDFLPTVCDICVAECFSNPDLHRALEPEPYAIEGLQAIAKMGTLHLVSSCEEVVGPAIEEWLVDHQIRSLFSTVTTGAVNKTVTCQLLGLDCLVDDKPDTLLKVANLTSTMPIIFDKAWNRHINVGFRVPDWPALVDLFKQVQGFNQNTEKEARFGKRV